MKKNDFLIIVFWLPMTSHALSLGITGGLISPYGLGVEIQQQMNKNIVASAGTGFFIDGLKLGIGGICYARDEKKLNPLAEIYVSYSTGLDGISLKTGTSSKENDYSFPASIGFYAGGGVRWNIVSWLSLEWSLGYKLNWLMDGVTVNGVKTNKVEDETVSRFISSGIYFMVTCQFNLKK